MAFAELLARSAFSFLRGASQPEEMVERAKDLGLASMAICDRDGLYGTVRAHARAREIGFRTRVGAEITVSAPGRDRNEKARAPLLVALLVETHEGYGNLCRLLTRAHEGLPKGESAAEADWIAEHSAGLVALVPADAGPDTPDADASRLLDVVRDAFGPRAFIAAYRRLDGFDARLDEHRHQVSVEPRRRRTSPRSA